MSGTTHSVLRAKVSLCAAQEDCTYAVYSVQFAVCSLQRADAAYSVLLAACSK